MLEHKVNEVVTIEGKQGIKLCDLVGWYVENSMEKVESEEAAKELTLKARSIIQRLITQETTLVCYPFCWIRVQIQ